MLKPSFIYFAPVVSHSVGLDTLVSSYSVVTSCTLDEGAQEIDHNLHK